MTIRTILLPVYSPLAVMVSLGATVALIAKAVFLVPLVIAAAAPPAEMACTARKVADPLALMARAAPEAKVVFPRQRVAAGAPPVMEVLELRIRETGAQVAQAQVGLWEIRASPVKMAITGSAV